MTISPELEMLGKLVGTATLAGGVAWTLAITVGRPALDNAWMGTFRRKRPEVEALFREEIFKPDFDATHGAHEAIDRLIVSGERAEESLARLEKRHDDADRELRALPALAAAVDTCTSTLEQFTRDLNDVSGKLERFGGILDELRRQRS